MTKDAEIKRMQVFLRMQDYGGAAYTNSVPTRPEFTQPNLPPTVHIFSVRGGNAYLWPIENGYALTVDGPVVRCWQDAVRGEIARRIPKDYP